MSGENFQEIIKKFVYPEAGHLKKMRQDGEEVHSSLIPGNKRQNKSLQKNDVAWLDTSFFSAKNELAKKLEKKKAKKEKEHDHKPIHMYIYEKNKMKNTQ